MGVRVALGYGRRPYRAELPDGARVIRAPTPTAAAPPVVDLLERALHHPIASPRLEQLVVGARRVVVIVSDATRHEPRDSLARAVLARIPPGVEVTLAVATGTHGPCDVADLGLGREVHDRVSRWVVHDGRQSTDLVCVGTTRRGTPAVLHRSMVEADVIVATGCIIPHYFAGYGAGIKAVFPGLGGATEIRINHVLKGAPGARAGVVEGNPCREDMEEVADLLGRPIFVLNAVVDDLGHARAAVAGDVREAFRAGAAACEPLYRIDASPCGALVISDDPPVTATLYQASKLVAAVAPLVAPRGTIILAAECDDGTGPLDTVNRGIYELGIRPRLPTDHRVVLVSSLAPDVVGATYCEWAPSIEEALAAAPHDSATPLVLPRAARLLCRPVPS